MWSQFTNVTDRQTDRQTTCDRNTALCTKVHRAVKNFRKPQGFFFDSHCTSVSIKIHFNDITRRTSKLAPIHNVMTSSSTLWLVRNKSDRRLILASVQMNTDSILVLMSYENELFHWISAIITSPFNPLYWHCWAEERPEQNTQPSQQCTFQQL